MRSMIILLISFGMFSTVYASEASQAVNADGTCSGEYGYDLLALAIPLNNTLAEINEQCAARKITGAEATELVIQLKRDALEKCAQLIQKYGSNFKCKTSDGMITTGEDLKKSCENFAEN